MKSKYEKNQPLVRYLWPLFSFCHTLEVSIFWRVKMHQKKQFFTQKKVPRATVHSAPRRMASGRPPLSKRPPSPMYHSFIESSPCLWCKFQREKAKTTALRNSNTKTGTFWQVFSFLSFFSFSFIFSSSFSSFFSSFFSSCFHFYISFCFSSSYFRVFIHIHLLCPFSSLILRQECGSKGHSTEFHCEDNVKVMYIHKES